MTEEPIMDLEDPRVKEWFNALVGISTWIRTGPNDEEYLLKVIVRLYKASLDLPRDYDTK